MDFKDNFMPKSFFLLVVEDDIEPNLKDPFITQKQRDDAAKQHREMFGDSDGLYAVDVDWDKRDIQVFSYGAQALLNEDQQG